MFDDDLPPKPPALPVGIEEDVPAVDEDEGDADALAAAAAEGLAIDDLVGEDLSVEENLRLLLSTLSNAIAFHVESGDFQPSVQLELAMEGAKHELWSR